MSHAVVLVLIPEGTKNIEAKVEELLAPYDENLEVPEYEKVCWCVGQAAKSEVRTEADLKFGTVASNRDRFWRENPLDIKASEEEEAEHTAKWQTLMKPRWDFEEEAFAKHPGKDAPRADCESCHGTGKEMSTYSPKSKWDWWVIGGRWNGWLKDYDPTTDERNFEVCWLCQGTGMRNDPLGKEKREKDPTYTCNGCGGTGKQLKFGDHVPQDTNICSTEFVLSTGKIPFAIVTPDGEWHERGDMGWFGIVSNEKDKDEWKRIATEILEANRNTGAVTVDFHI